ncbi:MAG TPA: serine/threonine-protein kinase [Pirellulales bacterium]|jgi:serine/threonine protein kinase|nr:serine/threonine-protein kinase [Pirellulales bacterium]
MSHVVPDAKLIFLEAIEKESPEEVARYLDVVCQNDAALRGRIERLLRAHQYAGKFLGGSATSDPTPDEPLAEMPGTVIGPYKLLEQIGEGGFGVVFTAEQSKPIQRKVALKIIKPGMDTRQVIARFEAERQALALMDHPNIAKVLDAGTTASGQPYFVMELVRGVPVTEYCDEKKLATRDRLELFVAVCQAVQHAHQKGIIHRDIKPTNVLVTLHDGRPVIKVIDFGVAKATGQELTDKTLFTGFTQMIGTPLYMSPEQAEMSGLDVDTRSDIFSAGVLLYELLTGTTPFDSQRLKSASFDELRRIIREEEPSRPSTRLTTLALEAASTVGTQRKSDPRQLSRLFRGELDWIVMKCLEKDRARRYETASALGADVERYLSDEPVQAAPPSARYRLRKFAHKHRAALATAAVTGLLLMVGAAVSTWQAVRATWAEEKMGSALSEAKQAKALMEDALKESEEARRQAEAVTNSLVKLFRSADPREDGRVIRLADLLDHAAVELDANFTDSSNLKADLLATLGFTYQGLRLYARAGEMFEKARALRQATLGPDHPKTLMAMRELAWALRGTGRLDEAIALAEEALRRQRAKLGASHRDTLLTASILGDAYRMAARPDEAIRLLEPSLELCKTKLGKSDDVTFQTMNNLALAYQVAGRLPEAMELFKQSLALMKDTLGRDHPQTLNTTNNLAEIYLAVGQPGQVMAILEESLPACKARCGPDHPLTVTGTYELAAAYEATDQPAKARQLLLESATSMPDQYGPDTLEPAGALAELGRRYLLQKRYTLAESILRECLAVRKQKMPDAWTTFDAKSLLGSALLGQQKLDKAGPLLIQALDEMKECEATMPASGKPHLAEAIERIVLFYEVTGKPDDAAKWRKELEARKAALERFKPDKPRSDTSPGAERK